MSETQFANSWYAKQREQAYRARWIGIGSLFVGHGVLDFVAGSKAINSGDIYFVLFLFGASFAQLSLIATWAVFADRPLVTRILSTGYQIYAMGLALLLGLYINSQGRRTTMIFDWQTVGLTWILLIPAVFITIAIFRLIEALCLNPRLTMPEQRAVLAPTPQTSLRRFLRDVGIFCVLLAITRGILPGTGKLAWDDSIPRTAMLVLHGTIASLLLTPPILGICFCPRQWGFWRGMLALLLWPAIVAIGMHRSFALFQDYLANHGVAGTACFCLGTIVSYGISVAVLRTVGFELRFPNSSAPRP